MKYSMNLQKTQKYAGNCLRILLSAVGILWTVLILWNLILSCGFMRAGTNFTGDYDILGKFDQFINNSVSDAAEEFIYIEKHYELSDADQVAPRPAESNFGTAMDPAELKSILDKAQKKHDIDSLIFSTETPIWEGSEINYYLDDTIFAVTWKQPIDHVMYTISEIKIAHASQFRRFLSDGEFGSVKQYLTSQMSSSVNAVVASAGDFYKHRPGGIVIYNGDIKRFNPLNVDACFINDSGDLIFEKVTSFDTEESLHQFIENNHIRFNLCFGPVLIDNGELCIPGRYPLGEIHDNFARSALCQVDELHYLLVTANSEGGFGNFPTIASFAKVIHTMGVDKAYTLDGGQTATIVMNNQVINRVSYGSERYISDIIYFCTALPDKS